MSSATAHARRTVSRVRRGASDLGTRLEAWFGVLGERNFLFFFVGYSASVIGYTMAPVAMTFAVLEDGYGADGISLVMAAETLALVVLLLFAGVLADRVPRKLNMLTSNAVRGSSQAVLATLLLTGRPPLLLIAGAGAVLGVCEAFLQPALIGLIPEMVSSRRLQQANALRSTVLAAGGVAGPVVAGVIVAADGAGWAIAIDSATYLFSALCLIGVRVPKRVREAPASMFRELLDGWREVRSRSWLWLLMAQAAIFWAGAYAPFMVVGAVVTEEHLGGAASWGFFNAMIGVGSIIGGLVAIRVHSTRPLVTYVVAIAIYSIPIALIAIPTLAWLIAVGAAVGGAGFAIAQTFWETTLHHEVPREILSRVSAWDWFGATLLMPIGYGLAGPLADAFGNRRILTLAAALAVLPSLAVVAAPSVRNLRTSVAEPDAET